MVYISSVLYAAKVRLRHRVIAGIGAFTLPTVLYAVCIVAEFVAIRYLDVFGGCIKPMVLLLNALLVYPLRIGMRRFYLSCERDSSVCFDFYSSARLLVNATGSVLVRQSVMAAAMLVLIALPARLFYAMLSAEAYILIGCGLLVAAGVYLTFCLSFSLFAMPYLTAASGINPFRALYRSYKAMRRHRTALLRLYIALLPRLLLCLLIIPAFYQLPFIRQALSFFASELIQSRFARLNG